MSKFVLKFFLTSKEKSCSININFRCQENLILKIYSNHFFLKKSKNITYSINYNKLKKMLSIFILEF